jgi:lipopolysaccharide biosynthesis regulator YciM
LVSCYDYAKQKDKVINLLASSKFAKTVKYQLLLGNIYYNQEKFGKSIKVLENINIKKGSKKDGQRNTLLALSYYELNNKKATVKYLKKAINNPYEKKRALSIKKSLQI